MFLGVARGLGSCGFIVNLEIPEPAGKSQATPWHNGGGNVFDHGPRSFRFPSQRRAGNNVTLRRQEKKSGSPIGQPKEEEKQIGPTLQQTWVGGLGGGGFGAGVLAGCDSAGGDRGMAGPARACRGPGGGNRGGKATQREKKGRHGLRVAAVCVVGKVLVEEETDCSRKSEGPGAQARRPGGGSLVMRNCSGGPRSRFRSVESFSQTHEVEGGALGLLVLRGPFGEFGQGNP